MFRVSQLASSAWTKTTLTQRISIMAQVFVVVAAGSVIGFIVRDLGDGAIAGWIIQVCQSACLYRVSNNERMLGSSVDAKRSVTSRGSSFRCAG